MNNKKVRTQKDIQNHPATFDIYKSTENGWVLELNDGWEWAPDAQICNEPTLKEMCYVLNELVYQVEKTEPKTEMVRKDEKDNWAWDFKVDGFNFWMTAVKDSEGMWSFITWYDGEQISTDFDTKKWTGWENRKQIVKDGLSLADVVLPTEPTEAVKKAKKKVAKVKKQLSGLNDNEQAVFEALYQDASLNGGDFGFTDEVVADTEIYGQYNQLGNYEMAPALTKSQIKGYIGSIAKKDLIWISTTDYGYQQFGFTDKGWEVVNQLNLALK